jgi:hypothetical protein
MTSLERRRAYATMPIGGRSKNDQNDQNGQKGESVLVPYFVSMIMHEYLKKEDGKNTFDFMVAFVDFFLHAGAWIAVLIIDIVLFGHEGVHFVSPAYTTMFAAVACVSIAAGTVIVLWLYDLCAVIEVGFLPASFTSLITGTARASLVFGVLTSAILSFQLVLIEAIPTYTPEHVANGHVFRMLIASIALKLFGVAATVNNHRLHNNEANLIGAS